MNGGGGGGGGQASYYSQARLLPGELYLECNSVSGHAHHFGEGGGGGGGGGGCLGLRAEAIREQQLRLSRCTDQGAAHADTVMELRTIIY